MRNCLIYQGLVRFSVACNAVFDWVAVHGAYITTFSTGRFYKMALNPVKMLHHLQKAHTTYVVYA
jgi:hypothetical protein